jgi:hypothetical protein
LLLLLGMACVLGSCGAGRSTSDSSAKPQTHAAPAEPLALVGFTRWSRLHQLQILEQYGTQPDLPAVSQEFLLTLIRDRSYDPVMRNLAANALVIQAHQVTDYARIFLELSDDPAQSAQWRDYCLQDAAFLADSVNGPISRRLIAELIQISESDEERTGTALLQLCRIQRLCPQGVPLDTTWWGRRFAHALLAPEQNCKTSITVLGLIALRRDAAERTLVYRCLWSPEASIRRTAVATLGCIGNREDEGLIRRATADPDSTVQYAARMAERTLRERCYQPGGAELGAKRAQDL